MTTQNNNRKALPPVSLENFRDVDYKYVKFYSLFSDNTVRLNIIDYPAFKQYLLENYDENQLPGIFTNCPYTLKVATREDDMKEFMNDNIIQFSGLKVAERGGKKMVFINKTRGEIYHLKEMHMLRELDDNLLEYDEFVEYLFDDFVAYRSRVFREMIEKNFRRPVEPNDSSPRSLVDKIAALYKHYEDKVYIDEELKERKGFVLMFTHFAFLEIWDDSTVGIAFRVNTLPDVAATQILKLKEIEGIGKILIYENFYVNDGGKVLWDPKVNVELSET